LRSLFRGLPRAVVALGAVSFFTDVSSEMIVPLLPAFLLALGGSAATLGFIEGFADTAAGLLKLVSGAFADRAKRRKPLVVLGYGVSSLVKPLTALAALPWHVFVVRFLDRLGKGTRTSPRDALVADVTPPAERGRAFGLHRSMDHLGNVAGPLIAWLVLAQNGGTTSLGEMRALFWLAAVPAALALATLVFVVKEPPGIRAATGGGGAGGGEGGAAARVSILPPAVPALRRFLLAHFVFGLGESTDAFLLLRARELGVSIAQLPLLTAALHVVKSALGTPLGALSDRLPRRGMILAGWVVYAAVYAGFALATTAAQAWLLFVVYGLYYALVEGAERAYVAELAPPTQVGRAFGSYHFVTAIAALPASWTFGWLMNSFGSPLAFATGAGFAAAGAVLLSALVRRPGTPAPPAA
jgi:MFS family permease